MFKTCKDWPSLDYGKNKGESKGMHYEDENIWLTQKVMATLYDVDVRAINYNIKNI